MPIYEFRCQGCGRTSEVLVRDRESRPECPECGGNDLEKLISSPSSLTGRTGQDLPGPGDTACCGSSPAQPGCAGPGSCCGKGGPG